MSIDTDPFSGLDPQDPNRLPDLRANMPPEMRERYERSAGLPVGAKRIIESLRVAEVGEDGNITEIREAVERALAFKDGLLGTTGSTYELDPDKTKIKGPEGLRNKNKIARVQAMFTVVETSIRRPNPTYLDLAIQEAVDERIEEVNFRNENPAAWEKAAREEIILESAMRASQIGGRPYRQEEIEEEVDRRKKVVDKTEQAVDLLNDLSFHVHTRDTYDDVYILRQRTCENPKGAANLGIEIEAPTPDAMHWYTLFQSEAMHGFGEGAEQAFEEIVKFGLPDAVINRIGMTPIPPAVRQKVPSTIYSQGFASGVTFGHWFRHLYESSGKRMDRVWAAWRIAQITEVIDGLGESIKQDDGKFVSRDLSGQSPEAGKYVLAAPPFGSALFTFLAHFREKQMIEYGLRADGKRYNNDGSGQIEKFISHSGLPVNFLIGESQDLCLDYFHESRIKMNKAMLEEIEGVIGTMLKNFPIKNDPRGLSPDYDPRFEALSEEITKVWNDPTKEDGSERTVEISLWDLWLYGRLKFSDPRFPWFATDQPDPEAAPNELPPGSIGGWFLQRNRAFSIKETVVSTGDEIGQPGFFKDKLRNWAKVLGGLKPYDKNDPKTFPENNPRARVLLGWLWFRTGGTSTKSKFTKGNPETDYRTVARQAELLYYGAAADQKGLTTGDVLWNARECGWIRKIDEDWILEQIGKKLQ